MPPTVRVLIADDHPLWRRAVRDLLAAEADLHVAAEASDGHEALRAARAGGVDVAILDVEMPGMSGLDVARTLQAEGSAVRVLALTSYGDPTYAAGLLASGASGYLTKDHAPEFIVEAVRAVAGGASRWSVLPAPPASESSSPTALLSRRERDVLTLLTWARSNKEIAAALFLSENTVRNHLTRAYARIGVAGAREATAWAWANGLGQDGEIRDDIAPSAPTKGVQSDQPDSSV